MWFNGIVIWLLKSPLHFFMSKNTMLVEYMGRKSGKTYQVPVNYMKIGYRFVTTSVKERQWWRNLRGGVPVYITIKGRRYAATAEVVESGDALGKGLKEVFQAFPQYARYYEVELVDGVPAAGDLQRLSESNVLVYTTLDD